jgi:competence protein ComEC
MNDVSVPNLSRKAAATGAIVLLLLAFTALNGSSAALGDLQAVFLDVGQGDAELLRDANGFSVLIDGGDVDQGPVVLAYLRDHGFNNIDVLVASHPDADHIGGLVDVLLATDITVGAVVHSGYPGDSGTWDEFLNAAAARHLTPTIAQFPADYTWGEMTVHVLNPPAGLVDPDTNDASVVLLVDHGEVNFLFTGDISSAVEADVLARGTPVAAEVLKVAHHGSSSSSGGGFLSAVGARESIIEVGDNDYGHPAEDTLQRLAEAGSRIWRTDRNGNVYVVSDGAAYTITADRLWMVFLPSVSRSVANPTPTTEKIVIGTIFYNGTVGSAEPDEYVEIINQESYAVNVRNWTLRDQGGKVFTFPSYNMQPGQVCRVYTNENHPEWCGFNYASGSAIWNNGGDCATLRDDQGQAASSKCYD